jgi:hypothetical protein
MPGKFNPEQQTGGSFPGRLMTILNPHTIIKPGSVSIYIVISVLQKGAGKTRAAVRFRYSAILMLYFAALFQ